MAGASSRVGGRRSGGIAEAYGRRRARRVPWSAVRVVDPVPNVELRRDRHGHDLVVLSFPYRADVVDAVRAIPGRRFDWDSKEWSAPQADVTAPYVKGILERFPDLLASPEAQAWLEEAVAGWVGRIGAARRDGRGWFVLDGIAGELPEELEARSRAEGRRRWLPLDA